MGKEKISKAEQKKLETQNKRAFTQSVFSMTVQAIPPAVEFYRRKIQVSISGQNYNRYIRFSAYGKSCNILIYQDGNVAVELYEACHGKITEQMFQFTVDEAAQQEFERHFTEVLGWLIPVFLGNVPYDFHTFMDYVSGFKDIEKAYEWVERDFRRSQDAHERKESVN
jgi:hypothetical protein